MQRHLATRIYMKAVGQTVRRMKMMENIKAMNQELVRQTDRQTGTYRQRQTDRQTHTYIRTDSQAGRQTGRQAQTW